MKDSKIVRGLALAFAFAVGILWFTTPFAPSTHMLQESALLGWLRVPLGAIAQGNVNPWAMLDVVAVFVALCLAGHLFLSSTWKVWREAAPTNGELNDSRPWKLDWSIKIACGLVLLMIAGAAGSGLAYQSLLLAAMRGQIVENFGDR